jgi:hypothetical protein
VSKQKQRIPKHVKIEGWLWDAVTENLGDGEELLDVVFRGRASKTGAPPGWIAVIKITRLGRSIIHGMVWNKAAQPSYADVQQMVSHTREQIDAAWSRSVVDVTKEEINTIIRP